MKTIGNKAALMKQLVALSTPTAMREDEFTVDDYVSMMKESGIVRSREGHRCQLKMLIDEGKITSRKITLNGKSCNAYSFVK